MQFQLDFYRCVLVFCDFQVPNLLNLLNLLGKAHATGLDYSRPIVKPQIQKINQILSWSWTSSSNLQGYYKGHGTYNLRENSC